MTDFIERAPRKLLIAIVLALYALNGAVAYLMPGQW